MAELHYFVQYFCYSNSVISR